MWTPECIRAEERERARESEVLIKGASAANSTGSRRHYLFARHMKSACTSLSAGSIYVRIDHFFVYPNRC